MNKEEYIEKVLAHIQNKAFVSTIRQEIKGHIDDRELYYKDCGYDTETAQQKAIEHMGSADKLGIEMDLLHDYKKQKIVCIIGLVVFILNLICIKYLSSLIFNDYISPQGACISMIIACIVYRCAFVSRCRIILFLQGIASFGAALYFTENFNLTWIFSYTESDDIFEIICAVSVAVMGIMFFIHSIMCLTCSGEVNALIKGKPNNKILRRYEIYGHILSAFSIACAVLAVDCIPTIIEPFLQN